MVLQALKRPVAKVKLATVLMGVMLMGLGLHSHFKSSWNKQVVLNINGERMEAKFYHICGRFLKDSDINCPGISKERFFVAMVIIHFFVSIASFVATLLDKTRDNVKIKWGDIIYHVVMGLLLLSSSILYMTSAEQIHKLVNHENFTFLGVKMLRGEKLVAGIFGFIQGILYGVVSFFVFREG